MSPLWRMRSIKVKFAIVIVSAIVLRVITSQLGYAVGLPIWLRPDDRCGSGQWRWCRSLPEG